MIKSLSRAPLFVLLGSSLLAACSNIPHDNDRLYVHGYIATAGETLLNPEVDTEKLNLQVQLIHGETIISQNNLTAKNQWPNAYKLEFTPVQVEELEGQPTLQLLLQSDDKQTLLYQQEIDLNDPLLFATQKDIIISPYSAKTTTNDEQKAQHKEQENTLYETFNCEEDGKTLKAIINQDYVILAEPALVLPRTIGIPKPIYMSADTSITFHAENEFILKLEKKETHCMLNADSFPAWKNAQENLKNIQNADKDNVKKQ